MYYCMTLVNMRLSIIIIMVVIVSANTTKLPADFVKKKLDRHIDSPQTSRLVVYNTTELEEVGKPETYGLPSLIIWDPINLFPEHFPSTMDIMCPCGGIINMVSITWTTNKHRSGRTVMSLYGEMYVITTIHVCRTCQDTFLGWDDLITKHIPPHLLSILVTHRWGLYHDVIDLIQPMISSGLAFSKIERILQHFGDEQMTRVGNRYLSDIAVWSMRHMPTTFLPVPVLKLNHNAPGRKLIIGAFMFSFENNCKFYIDDMCTKSARILSMDHTFKSAVNVGSVRHDAKWRKHYSSLFLVLNEKKEVIIESFLYIT